jgi:hypothetical protein
MEIRQMHGTLFDGVKMESGVGAFTGRGVAMITTEESNQCNVQ